MEFAPLTTKELDGIDVGSGTDCKKILYHESTPATCSIAREGQPHSIITDTHGMTELLQKDKSTFNSGQQRSSKTLISK